MTRTGPLGIFDSGVGGLTVVGEILRRYPGEQILYLADQAHVPYGGRPLEEIKKFATEISAFLADQGCRAIIMACNISSAVALPSVRKSLEPLPVFGMIDAAARQAAQDFDHPIGVLATAGTVKSRAYTCQIQEIAPRAQVVEIACPGLVPLVEAGETDTDEAFAATREYLQPLAEAGCQTIILGCTHYPYLQTTLNHVAAEFWTSAPLFIDPAEELVLSVARQLGLGESGHGNHTLLTTGDRMIFERQAPLFVQGLEAQVEKCAWDNSGCLQMESLALP